MKNAFDILKEMSRTGKDIKLAPLTNIINLNRHGVKGEVTIGVDLNTINRLHAGEKFYGGLILANKKEYEEIEKRFAEEAKQENIK